jgi:hypothetical protein
VPQRSAKRRTPFQFSIGRMPGTIACVDAPRGAGVAEAQEGLGLEEELGDRAVGPGLELALEPANIGLRSAASGCGSG